MSDSPMRDDVHTHVVGDAFRRFGLRIILAAVIIGVLVGAYAYLRPGTYTSTATVLVRPLSGNALSSQTSTSSQSTTVAMETEASLVTSQAVTDRVNTALGTDLVAGGNVSSKVPANSQIVQITYVARTARDAQRRAQAYAHAFLDYRSDLAADSQKALIDRLNARVTAVQQQLQQALADAARKTNRPADADTRVRLFTSNLASLQSEIGQVQSASTVPGNVVTPAALPTSPTGLSPVLLTAGGVIIGFVVAFGIAVWRERTDDRIRGGAEPTLLGLPVLAVLPDPPAGQGGKRADGGSVRADALRRGRTGLLAVTPTKAVIAVAGISEAQPALSAAADLARTVAAAGYRVTLVDAAGAPAHRPGWLPAGGAGLSDLLDGPAQADLPVRTVDGVRVLGAGRDPGGAAEKYAGQRTREVLDQLRDDADYVLVATAPADSSEGMAMLLAVDGVVLMASDQLSTHAQLAATTSAARRLGATVLGLLIHQATGGRKALATAAHEAATGAKENRRGGKKPADGGDDAQTADSDEAALDGGGRGVPATAGKGRPARESRQRGSS